MDSEYDLEFFRKENFKRKRCASCGRFFWTQGESDICGEPPCGEYTFIGNSPMNRKFDLHSMREFYLNFFEERDHMRISRYPITARWRDDVFFTQASIYDFQPYVTSGVADPPANPLVISQPCVRFNDIDNVGKTGRHFTMFEMMAHHVFNKKDNFIYFKDKTVELCNDLLTKSLGIHPNHITYIEAEWEGGGNAGPCFEVIVDGIELATLVFMMYRVVDGVKYPMDIQVVDTGYGLERFVWMSQGTENAYEAVFGRVLEYLKDKAGIQAHEKILSEYSRVAGNMNIESNKELRVLHEEVAKRIGISVSELTRVVTPYENLYAVCDHTRALMFLLNDGVIPSNTKAGYFARLLARRIIRAMNNLDLKLKISEIVDKQIEFFKESFPELAENRDEILKLTDIEEEKYNKTLLSGREIVRNMMKKKKISVDDLIFLYDSYGLNPEIVKEFMGIEISIPDNFYSLVALRHEKIEKEKEKTIEYENIPPTILGYYENPEIYEFTAKVLKISDNQIILDKTYFYPEGGGQESDTGQIDNLHMLRAVKYGNIVVHEILKKDETNNETNKKIKEGDLVECKIDKERRIQLTNHHSATHIINGAARKILGNHIWQAGAHKSVDIARLDITHYSLLTDEELSEIENLANKIVIENRKIEISLMERNDAEKKYGFRLYQGGAVPSKFIRVVDIKDFDVEACGGTHNSSTRDVGLIKILRQKRIQDGILRLEYVAGNAALKSIEKKEKILDASAKVFSVQIEDLPKTCERFFSEWKQLRKENKELRDNLKDMLKENLKEKNKYGLESAVEVDFLDLNEVLEVVKELNTYIIVNFRKKFIVTNKKLDEKLVKRGDNFNVYVFDEKSNERIKRYLNPIFKDN